MAEAGIDHDPGALRDLEDTIDFLWERSPDLARRFAEAYRGAILTLREFPQMGSPLGDGERRLQIQGWPYSLVYRFSGQTVLVIALAHASRRPGYWRGRL